MKKTIISSTIAFLYSLCLSAQTINEGDALSTEKTKLISQKSISKFTRKYSRTVDGRARLEDFNLLDLSMQEYWAKTLLDVRNNGKIEFVDYASTNLKVIAEAWLSKGRFDENDKQTLQFNLSMMKSLGYNSVLVRFDCSEDLDQLKSMVDTIRACGLSIVMAYTGPEYSEPKWNPFQDRELLSQRVQYMASVSEAIILNWRSMVVHLRLLPIEFFTYLAMEARKSNPNIAVFGEVFHGGLDSTKRVGIEYTNVTNMTGYLVTNLGYLSANMDYALGVKYSEVVPGFKNMKNIGQVVGYCAYFRSKNNAGLGTQKEFSHKKKVEDAFNKRGLMTVTYLHDGCDDHLAEKYDTTDNLVYNQIELIVDENERN